MNYQEPILEMAMLLLLEPSNNNKKSENRCLIIPYSNSFVKLIISYDLIWSGTCKVDDWVV